MTKSETRSTPVSTPVSNYHDSLDKSDSNVGFH